MTIVWVNLDRSNDLTADGVATPPLPIEPTAGQAAVLNVVSSIPIFEVDAAKDRFPVPFVVEVQHAAGDFHVAGRVGAPLRIDIDDSKTTGQGGSDVVLHVDLTPGVDPYATVNLERLGSDGFVTGAVLTVIIPFDGYLPATAEGPSNLILSIDTVGGALPSTSEVTLIPGALGGAERTSSLTGTFTDQPAQMEFVAGHTHGDSTTGVTDYALFNVALDPAPANFESTLAVGESLGAAALASNFQFQWNANVPTDLLLDVIEDQDYSTPLTADFVSSLQTPTTPTTFDFSSDLDDAVGNHDVVASGDSAIGELGFQRTRQGNRTTLTADDWPSSASLVGNTNGEWAYSTTSPTADIDLLLLNENGYSDTDEWLGADVKQIRIIATDLPSTAVGLTPPSGVTTSRLISMETDGIIVPKLELAVSTGVGEVPVSPEFDTNPSQHAASLVDDGTAAAVAMRVLDAEESIFSVDPLAVETEIILEADAAAVQNIFLELDSSSVLSDSIEVSVNCLVDSLPAGESTFSTDFVGSISYMSDPASPLDEVSCTGEIGTLITEFGMRDIPGDFSFAFDPDSGIDADFGSAMLTSLEMYLRTSDGTPLPTSSGDLFGDPLSVARLRLDSLSTLDADWLNTGGLSVLASTGTPDVYLGGIQLGVSTSASTLPVFGDIQSIGRNDILFEDDLSQSLDLALAGVGALNFSHTGESVSGSLEAVMKPGSSLPLELDLASLFDTPQLFSGACSIDPLPPGGIDLETDYATSLLLIAPGGVDNVDCSGIIGSLVFSTELTGLPSSVAIDFDPESQLSASLSEPMDSLELVISDPNGIIPAADLLGVPVRRATMTVTDIPSMTATWSVDLENESDPGRVDVSIDATNDGESIGSIAFELDENPPDAVQFVSYFADHNPPAPNCGVNLNTISTAGSPAQLAANILSTPLTTFSLSSSGLTMNVTTNTAQVCAVNINTSYPTNPPDLTVQSPFVMNCVLDQAPAGTFSFTTNFLGTFATTSPDAIDEFQCVGQNGTALYDLLFQDIPETMAMSVGSGVTLSANDGSGGEAEVGLAMVELSTTSEEFGLLGTSALFGEDLRYLGVRLDDAPSTAFDWEFTPGESSVAVDTTPLVPADQASVGGLQFLALASTDQLEFLTLDAPSSSDDQLLRFFRKLDPRFQILEARLFGVERFSFAQLIDENGMEDPGETECVVDDDDEMPVRILNATIEVTEPRNLVGIVSSETPVEGSEPATIQSSTAVIALENDLTYLDLCTDTESHVGYEANSGGSIASLELSTNDHLFFASPDEVPEEATVPLPTTMSLELTGLPDELMLGFTQEGVPGGDSSNIEIAMLASGPVEGIAVHSSKPDADDDASPVPEEQTAHLDGIPAEIDLEFSMSTTPAANTDDPPTTSVTGVLEASDTLERIFLETVDPVVDKPETNRWTKMEVLGIPAYVFVSLTNDAKLINVDLTGSNVPPEHGDFQVITEADGIETIRLLQTTVLPGEETELFEPFTEGADGNSCFITEGAFENAIAGRAFSNDLNGHIDSAMCDSFGVDRVGFDDSEDHMVTTKWRTQRIREEGDDAGGPDYKLVGEDPDKKKSYFVDFVNSMTSVQFSGLQGAQVKIDLEPPSGEIPPEPGSWDPEEEETPESTYIPEGSIFFSAPSAEPHPIFIGDNSRLDRAIDFELVPFEQLQLIRIENIPDVIEVEMKALESIYFEASESPGQLDYFTGPRGGTETGETAQKFSVQNAPSAFSIDYTGIPKQPTAEDPEQPWFFEWEYSFALDASDQFRVLGAIQDAGSRTLLGFDLEDFAVDLSSEGLGYTPCDPVDLTLFGLSEDEDTCYGLFKANGTINALGNVSQEGVEGFLLYWPILNDPEDLDDGDENPNPDSWIAPELAYVPGVTFIVRDFEFLGGGVEIQFDATPFLPDLEPAPELGLIDIELGFVTIPVITDGDVIFDFWDQDFDVCYDPPELAEEQVVNEECIEDISINGSDYVTNNPWHLLPLLHDNSNHFDVLP